MFREQFPGFLNAVDNAGCEFRFTKITAHGVRQFPPEDIPAFRMNRFITDHGKLVGTRGNEDQYTIPCRGLVHAQAQKFRLRGGHWIVNVFWGNADADFAGGFLFGFADGRDDGVVLHMFGKGFRVHKLPAPSRAAAAKAAAAAGKSAATATAESASSTKTSAAPAAV